MNIVLTRIAISLFLFISISVNSQILLTVSNETDLLENTDSYSTVLMRLPAHKNVELVDFIPDGNNGGYFKVKVYETMGYIDRNSVVYDEGYYLALRSDTEEIATICFQNMEVLKTLNNRKIYEESFWSEQQGFEAEQYCDLIARLDTIVTYQSTNSLGQETDTYEPEQDYLPGSGSNNIGYDNLKIVKVIQMRKRQSGTFEIPCKVNGLPLTFIFDTGASNVSISLTEALFMLKNDYLSEDDIFGSQYYSFATGEIAEGTSIRIRELEFGGLLLRNVDASIVHELEAPLLLGQSAISRLGRIQIDHLNGTLTIFE